MSKQIALRARRVHLAALSATDASCWLAGERSSLFPPIAFPTLPSLRAMLYCFQLAQRISGARDRNRARAMVRP